MEPYLLTQFEALHIGWCANIGRNTFYLISTIATDRYKDTFISFLTFWNIYFGKIYTPSNNIFNWISDYRYPLFQISC
jgi:hypothetical protein